MGNFLLPSPLFDRLPARLFSCERAGLGHVEQAAAEAAIV